MTQILTMDQYYTVHEPLDTAGGRTFNVDRWTSTYRGQIGFTIDNTNERHRCVTCAMTGEEIFEQRVQEALREGLELSQLARWTFSGWRSFITDEERDDWRPIDPLTCIDIIETVFLCWMCFPSYVMDFAECQGCLEMGFMDEMAMCECGTDELLCGACYRLYHGDCSHSEIDYYPDPDEVDYEFSDRGEEYIHPYYHRPDPNMLGSTEQIEALRGIWFGVENETQTDGMRRVPTLGALAHRDGEQKFYLKNDTSVSGVEIVSHPATLDYHRTAMHWEEILDAAIDDGHVDGEGAGLHVHVSRSGLGMDDEQTNAVIGNMINAMGHFWEQFADVAGREDDEWAQQNTYHYHEDIETVKATLMERLDALPSDATEETRQAMTKNYEHVVMSRIKREQDTIKENPNRRYFALNENTNHDTGAVNAATVEFRLFQSTMSSEHLLRVIETIATLVIVGKTKSPMEIWSMEWDKFIEIAHNNGMQRVC